MSRGLVDRVFEPRALYLASVLFILYATTMPWDLLTTADWSTVQWNPIWDAERGRVHGVPDMIQNLVLFLPLGFFGWLARRRIGEVLVTALAVSVSAEVLQAMSPTRTASTNDIVTNTTGACLGALGALFTASRVDGRWLRRVSRQPGAAVFAALLVAILFRSLAPFLPTLDVSALRAQLRAVIDNPWGNKNLLQLLFDIVLYAGFTVSLTRELPRLRGRPVRPSTSVAWALALGCAMEFGQLLFAGHQPAAQDVVSAWLGAALGAGVARSVGPALGQEPGELSRNSPGWALSFALLLPLLRSLDPFKWNTDGISVSGWSFVPFASGFAKVNSQTVANMFTVAAVYVPLAHYLRARRRPVSVGVIACGSYALILEILQLAVEGRTFDVTEALFAGLAAVTVTAFWNKASLQSSPAPGGVD